MHRMRRAVPESGSPGLAAPGVGGRRAVAVRSGFRSLCPHEEHRGQRRRSSAIRFAACTGRDAPSGGCEMNPDDAFERILESLYRAMLDDAHWPAASALIDEACAYFHVHFPPRRGHSPPPGRTARRPTVPSPRPLHRRGAKDVAGVQRGIAPRAQRSATLARARHRGSPSGPGRAGAGCARGGFASPAGGAAGRRRGVPGGAPGLSLA